MQAAHSQPGNVLSSRSRAYSRFPCTHSSEDDSPVCQFLNSSLSNNHPHVFSILFSQALTCKSLYGMLDNHVRTSRRRCSVYPPNRDGSVLLSHTVLVRIQFTIQSCSMNSPFQSDPPVLDAFTDGLQLNLKWCECCLRNPHHYAQQFRC